MIPFTSSNAEKKGKWDLLTHLRGDVVWRAAESARGVAPEHPLPAHPEVSDLDVALAVQQHIIQLQIPRKRESERERESETERTDKMDDRGYESM